MSGSGAASAALSHLDQHLRPLVLAGRKTLPVPDAFEGLLSGGLPRGVTVHAAGPAARSFAFALVAEASRAGEWLAVIGLPDLGWQAVAELGVVPTRIVTIDPEPDAQRAGDVVAAALDGFALVLLGPRIRIPHATRRRLAARARERGAVLIGVHEDAPGARPTDGPTAGHFAEIADLRATTRDGHWHGLGVGVGHLGGRSVAATLEGKRLPGRRRDSRLWLPGTAGGVTSAADTATFAAPGFAGHPTPSFATHRPGPTRPDPICSA